jgi:ribosomal protein L11 methyltransferase
VLANILKGPLIDLAPDMARHTATGGYAILSGLLTTQADDVINAYTEENFELCDQIVLGEWSSLTLRKS